MLDLLESNMETLQSTSQNYICEDDIYGILLKTGRYFNAKDIAYYNKVLLF